MATGDGGRKAPVPGYDPRDDHEFRPKRWLLSIGEAFGLVLLLAGLTFTLFGVFVGPSFSATETALPGWDNAMHTIGAWLTGLTPWGIALMLVGAISVASAAWLRPRYPGRWDLRNNVSVRLYDIFGRLLHSDDCHVRVRRSRGIYRIYIRLAAAGLQYDEKRDAILKCVVGAGFLPPEICPYKGHRSFDLEVTVVSRLISDGYLDRWQDAFKRFVRWIRRGR